MSVQPSEHTLSMPPIDSTFPSTVPVAGKASYGIPVMDSLSNDWIERISQPFSVGAFNYNTSSSTTVPLFDVDIYPLVDHPNFMTWFHWKVCQYQAFQCEFDLEIELIKHSSHRGILSIATTLNPISTENLGQYFAPFENWDISGDVGSTYTYKIPNVYGFSSKYMLERARILNYPAAVGESPNPDAKYQPHMAFKLCHLTIMASVPLVSSSMLPSEITGIIKLVPNISTLKLQHPLLPSKHRTLEATAVPVWNNV